jgi:hypothetical protein
LQGETFKIRFSDFSGETSLVLKEKKEKKGGEYRTRHLVLEACGSGIGVRLQKLKFSACRKKVGLLRAMGGAVSSIEDLAMCFVIELSG